MAGISPYFLLKDLQARAGIKKHITMHLFRHSAATRMASHLTEQQMKQVLGWKPDSSMASVYVHLSGKDVDAAILKMNGIEVQEDKTDKLETVRCPRCHELNASNVKTCYKCGMILDPAYAAQEVTEKEAMKKQMEELTKMVDALWAGKNGTEEGMKMAGLVKKVHPNRIILLPDDGSEPKNEGDL